MTGPLIVIPARYGSSRFPGKPLASIGGLPMVVRTFQNTRAQAPANSVVLVATDDIRIMDACKRYAVPCVMTSTDCRTGTDRVAEVAARRPEHEIVINVQGDEPLMADGCVATIYEAVSVCGTVCCGAAPLNPKDVPNPNVGKVVVGVSQLAMYMSRAPIPFPFAKAPESYMTQVCIYGFPAEDLRTFAKLPTGKLEAVEGIELLRWMEDVRPVQMVRVPGERMAVDTPEDLERVRARIGGI